MKAAIDLYDQAFRVGAGWIHEMEHENRVPLDITKRKTIARLLKIPPMLLGLAVLEDLTLEPSQQTPPFRATGQTTYPKVTVDLERYENNVRTVWQLHKTGTAQSPFVWLEADIRELDKLEQQTQGDLQYHLQELLFGDQLVATHVIRDQGQFNQAYFYANKAVHVAKSMNDSDLIATALFTRGWTRLEWGLYSTTNQGIFQLQLDKIGAAIRDFTTALDLFPLEQEKTMHPQLQGLLIMFLSRSKALLAVSTGKRVSGASLMALDDIVDTIDRQNIEDPYIQLLVTGTQTGFHQAGYHDTRAAVFNAAQLPGQALKELNALETLIERPYERDETRQYAWLDILKANVYMGLGELNDTAKLARQALIACLDIHSVTNIAIIGDIYGRLLHSSHKASPDVQEIGDLLRTSSFVQTERDEE